MASEEEIADSDDSDNSGIKTPEPESANAEQSPPHSVLSYRFRDFPTKASDEDTHEKDVRPKTFSVIIPAPARPWEYQPFRGDTTVDTVVEEIEGSDDERWFRIEFEDGREEKVRFDKLIKLRNGSNALDMYENAENYDTQDLGRSSIEPEIASKRSRTKTAIKGFVNSAIIPLSDDELSAGPSALKKRRIGRADVSITAYSSRQSSRVKNRSVSGTFHGIEDDDDSDPEHHQRGTRPTRGASWNQHSSSRSMRSARVIQPKLRFTNQDSQSTDDQDELAGDDAQDESEDSDIVYKDPKARKKFSRLLRGRPQAKVGPPRAERGRIRKAISESESESPERPGRRSGRARPKKNMREHDMDEEVYAEDTAVHNGPKIISIREVYQPIEKGASFRRFHRNECEVCNGIGNNSNKGSSILVHCQGCSTSIHKVCLGYRSGRDHMVTKVGHEDFVLQCRRCIGVVAKKDLSAPRLDICQGCKEQGPSCKSFSSKKTAKQEEKLREENDGQDPITRVSPTLLNNAANILFRCASCHLGYHYEHLPGGSKSSKSTGSPDELREAHLKKYSLTWQCTDCTTAPAKVQTLVAWRPTDPSSYEAGQTAEEFCEDEKEYLIKWEGKSYLQCSWMPGGWVWGVTAVMMRNAFFRRDEGINLLPKWSNDEAIPEEYLRMEIIFEVSYASVFRSKSEKADKAAINMVEEVLVKFQGLGYEDAVWEDPPEPQETERWSDFVAAYNEFVAGKYFKQAPPSTMKELLEEFRASDFEEEVEMDKQPSALVGGEMMKYQMDGMNWLLYNFHQKKNVILADEMGLGKTIQIIAMLAALIKHNPKCWPFLVVTPNSTCPNWRREIKKWAPGLRVVAYYGAKKAREMAMKYELYPNGSKELSAHIVVTSYEAPVDDHSRAFFRRIKWAGMIVDEGQRLKNDENLLYAALKALKVPFQVLLTGTPLQNNKRELFNLLQFLDTSINAAKLDEKYAELTKDNLPELHELIRPFFLRRTKLQVLKFLPSMAQVILPVTMSVVQKKLYKSILARNPQLIKSIFGQSSAAIGPKDKSNLNNILMQLRKCLCHPFVYSNAIEERSVDDSGLHRNLVDASAKFQLLEIMLPKLRDRGHRVLIFSQFLAQLDLIEDFLNGLELPFGRLDGTIGALEKQRRIDAYNAEDSPLFAFLLSTRSGGVGINLATADTVIIMDPDFNPHQDIQALSRAHRIGQKKKVLCFQLMTKASAEEKIVQIGRKKMALDQALIESMDADDDAGVDLESILKFGAEALFNDDDRNDIRYDSASVDKLLDRAQVETTGVDEEKTAESQFSFARVWANDKAALTDDIGDTDVEAPVPDFSVWEKILKQREADAAQEAARNAQAFGRGKRARGNVHYEKPAVDEDMIDPSPRKAGKLIDGSVSDREFSAADSEEEEDDDEELAMEHEYSAQGIVAGITKGTTRKSVPTAKKAPKAALNAKIAGKQSRARGNDTLLSQVKKTWAPEQVSVQPPKLKSTARKVIPKNVALSKATSAKQRQKPALSKQATPALKASILEKFRSSAAAESSATARGCPHTKQVASVGSKSNPKKAVKMFLKSTAHSSGAKSSANAFNLPQSIADQTLEMQESKSTSPAQTVTAVATENHQSINPSSRRPNQDISNNAEMLQQVAIQNSDNMNLDLDHPVKPE